MLENNTKVNMQTYDVLFSNKPIYSTVMESMPEKPVVKENNRCHYNGCKKKLLLSDVSCKCKERYCLAHRLPETHTCTYDFKAEGKTQLTDVLQKVNGYKLERL